MWNIYYKATRVATERFEIDPAGMHPQKFRELTNTMTIGRVQLKLVKSYGEYQLRASQLAPLYLQA